MKGNLTLFPLHVFKTSTYTQIGRLISVAMFQINRKDNDLAHMTLHCSEINGTVSFPTINSKVESLPELYYQLN